MLSSATVTDNFNCADMQNCLHTKKC